MRAMTPSPGHAVSAFRKLLVSEAGGGLILMASAVIALGLANSVFSHAYFAVLSAHIAGLSVLHWINDGLMAVFFLLVGLEIKRELLDGQLRHWPQRFLPGMAALGGMMVPGLIYAAINASSPENLRGWAIPAATDIAFSLGVLALLAARVPVSLKVFLTALAILDDFGAVVIIAIFFTADLSPLMLSLAAAAVVGLLTMNFTGVTRLAPYLVIGAALWFFTLQSGVHATVAGVLVAMVVPVRSRLNPREFLELTDDRLSRLRSAQLTRDSLLEDRWQLDAISDLRQVAGAMRPPGLALEEALHPFVAFVILPLFAFFNAGVAVRGNILDGLRHPVGLGVVLGLVLGKQVGVTAFTWLAVKVARAERPEGVSWSQIYGGACLAGIGFTMSMFVDQLAFSDPENVDRAKIGILAASVVAAAWGGAVLAARLPRQKVQPTVTVPPKS